MNMKEFYQQPMPGTYLIFQESFTYGSSFPVVDIVSFDDGDVEEIEEDTKDSRLRTIYGWCNSAAADAIVTLEMWNNGEMYLSSEDHPRYRVTEIRPAEYVVQDPEDITTTEGEPVSWLPIAWKDNPNVFMQSSCDDKPGIRVELVVEYRDSVNLRKAFATTNEEADDFAKLAIEELKKPKYYLSTRYVNVSGVCIWREEN